MPDLDYERIFDPSEFDMKENYIFLKEEPGNPLLRVRLEEILREAHFREQGTMILSEAFYDPCNQMMDPQTCRGNVSATYIFGTQGVEVELPNAMKVILVGFRVALVINIGTAALAYLIGAGGLGDLIFTGISLMQTEKLLAGAIPITLLALVADFLCELLSVAMVSKGLRLSD